MGQLNSVIFKDKATAGLGKKMTSLFPGIGYAAGYKVCSLCFLDILLSYLG
jgi:hypothetical protein